MNSFAVKILLIREKQTFHASIACIQGVLKDLTRSLDQLHPKEHAIYKTYKYDLRKKSFLLGRLSAKQAILELTDINLPSNIWIDSGVFLFPVAKSSYFNNVQVSISHCEDIGLSIAFPEAHPMGIDLEKIATDKTEVILSQITDREKVLLQKITQDNISGYTCLFSIKEALSKVLKTGMMLDFNFLEVIDIRRDGNILECVFSHFGQYKAYSCIKGNYVIAIVLPKRTTVNLEQVWQMPISTS